MKYSGTITDTEGKPQSGTLGVTFALYKDQEGGAPLWLETQNVQADASGHYTAMAGSTKTEGLPADLFTSGEARWLGVQAEGEPEQPRSLLVSVPYAFKSHEAETLGGLPASAFVRATPADGVGDASGSTTQTAAATGSTGNTTKSGLGVDTVVNCASAKNNYIPVFTSSAPPNITICNSVIYQAGNNIGIGTTTPVTSLDVKSGAINTSLYYEIGGSTVVSIASPSDDNLFLGVSAGAANVAGSGRYNLFSGYQAGYSNTTGLANTFYGLQAGYSNTNASYNTFYGADTAFSNTTGSQNSFYGALAGVNNTTASNNTFVGFEAGQANTTGTPNVFVGWKAGLNNTTASENVFVGTASGSSNISCCNAFVGDEAGLNNTTGTYNAFFGRDAGLDNIDGSYDTFLGHWAGVGNTHGIVNTFVGNLAGYSNTTGSYDLFLGAYAGYNNTTGNYNIYVSNQGIGAESNTIRIGDTNQNAAFIAGIYGVNNGGAPVYINSNGQLGTSSSSRRFKENILDMGDSSSKLFQLRPVTFFYKPQYDDGSHLQQYGLIAEEVAKVYPEMVASDKDGQPYTVRYQLLAPMLLNELQKEHTVVEAQQDVIKAQQQQIQSLQEQNEDVQQRLSRLEGLLRGQVQTVARERE